MIKGELQHRKKLQQKILQEVKHSSVQYSIRETKIFQGEELKTELNLHDYHLRYQNLVQSSSENKRKMKYSKFDWKLMPSQVPRIPLNYTRKFQ